MNRTSVESFLWVNRWRGFLVSKSYMRHGIARKEHFHDKMEVPKME